MLSLQYMEVVNILYFETKVKFAALAEKEYNETGYQKFDYE